MMTEDDLFALYGEEACKPYSDEEYREHTPYRDIQNELEIEHAYNHEAIKITLEWIDFVEGRKSEAPVTMIWRILRPGKNITNWRCQRIEAIARFFEKYDQDSVPLLPIVVYCSRSAATLMDRLNRLYSSKHLDNAEFHFREFVSLISRQVPNIGNHADFVTAIEEHVKAIEDAFTSYSHDLGNYLRDVIRHKQLGDSIATKRDIAAIATTISHADESIKTTVKREAKKAVAAIKSDQRLDYEQRGPTSMARQRQFNDVVRMMREFHANTLKLPKPLRGKDPAKWIREACRRIWEDVEGGYPSVDRLYTYCYKNKERLLSLSGL